MTAPPEITVPVFIIVPLLTLVFGAGGCWLLIRITKRDVTGVGRNCRRMEKAIIFLAKDDQQRKDVIDILEDKRK